MSLLLKQVKVVDPQSPYNGQVVDIRIQEGKIRAIHPNISVGNATVWEAEGMCVSMGWLDLGTQIGDPGFEHKEDLESASKAATTGGFTAIACLPNTQPTIQSKSEVLYIKNRTLQDIVDFYPIGAISKGCEGKDMAELMDMHQLGAVAFSDGSHSVQNSGMMMRGLLYAKPFEGLLMNHPHDTEIAGKGFVHEGVISTSLGLTGIPALSEEMMVQRDLHLVEYAEGRLHFSNISSKGSVDLIRKKKAEGLDITASVNPMNLVYTDDTLVDFDSHYKVYPPLRSEIDRQALIEGLKDGTIDVICSNHTPQDLESKQLEFTYADFGVIMLETTYALLKTHLKDELSDELLVEKLALNPRKLLKLPYHAIQEGNIANLTVFQPNKSWTVQKRDLKSKSKNTPLIGQNMTAKVMGIVNNGQFKLIEN